MLVPFVQRTYLSRVQHHISASVERIDTENFMTISPHCRVNVGAPNSRKIALLCCQQEASVICGIMWMKAQLSVPVLNLDKFSVKQNWSQITIIVFLMAGRDVEIPSGCGYSGSTTEQENNAWYWCSWMWCLANGEAWYKYSSPQVSHKTYKDGNLGLICQG